MYYPTRQYSMERLDNRVIFTPWLMNIWINSSSGLLLGILLQTRCTLISFWRGTPCTGIARSLGTAVQLSKELYIVSHRDTQFDTTSNVWGPSHLPTLLEDKFNSECMSLNNSHYRGLRTEHIVCALDYHDPKGLSEADLLLNFTIVLGLCLIQMQQQVTQSSK